MKKGHKHPSHPVDPRSKFNYRPESHSASFGEAKALLRKRYLDRGYKVTKITRRNWHFVVSFGEDDQGRGKGPNTLKYILCNWPYFENAATIEEALKKRGITLKKTRRCRKRRFF